MNRKVLKVSAFILLCVGLILPGRVFSDSITFIAQVGDTILILKGYTSPGSLVSFTEKEVPIGTTSSDTTGLFEKKFTAQTEGDHEISIHSTDPKNKLTPSLVKNVTLIPFQITEIDDLFLPPSININQTNFNVSDDINISGYTKPMTALQILVSGKVPTTADLSSDENGLYTYTLKASEFDAGKYTAQSITKDSLDQITGKSFVLDFEVNPIGSNGTPSAIPISSSVLIPTLTPVESTTNPLVVLLIIAGLLLLILLILRAIYKSYKNNQKENITI